jgi:hypothetical protein
MSHVRQTSTLSLRPALWRFQPNTSFNLTAKKEYVQDACENRS